METWFFSRIERDRPIPIPGNGDHLTQLGHVADLVDAMVAVLDNKTAIGQIYNISGERYVSFDGLAQACAIAAGKDPASLKLVHYEPSAFDFGKRKAFPMRVQNFFADIHKAQADLNWAPTYDLVAGLKDSFTHDYLVNSADQEADFSTDDMILNA